MEPTFNNSCIVIKSSNSMKQSVRELIKCSIHTRPEDSYAVSSTSYTEGIQ